ncbi:MAG: LacI family DNA-binding transcriptional regulator [Atopobiaceae bacterium]|nr:LacI family DNA-binding transcriptional regulator [Atopobiaceae bacterium]
MAHGPGAGASLADVAKLAGVSAQTVSRVANGSDAVRPDTKERVLAAMAELGYRPSFAARSLRAGSYRSVGLAMSGDMAATGRRFQLEGVATAATKCQYAMTLLQLSDDEATLGEASRRMSSLPVDGQILYLGSNPDDFSTFEPPSALPTVIISTRHHKHCATVSNDQMGCSVSIVDYFIQKGHREIRFVGGRRDSHSNINRQKGWEQALRTRGLHVVEPYHGDWTADSGYEIGVRLAQDKECTAIFASNDAIAVGVIYALRDAGLRVPQDVSVMGVDDSLVGVIPHLDLSSYRFNDLQVGSIAFDLATNPPTGKEPPHILVPGSIIERSTVAQMMR